MALNSTSDRLKTKRRRYQRRRAALEELGGIRPTTVKLKDTSLVSDSLSCFATCTRSSPAEKQVCELYSKIPFTSEFSSQASKIAVSCFITSKLMAFVLGRLSTTSIMPVNEMNMFLCVQLTIGE